MKKKKKKKKERILELERELRKAVGLFLDEQQMANVTVRALAEADGRVKEWKEIADLHRGNLEAEVALCQRLREGEKAEINLDPVLLAALAALALCCALLAWG